MIIMTAGIASRYHGGMLPETGGACGLTAVVGACATKHSVDVLQLSLPVPETFVHDVPTHELWQHTWPSGSEFVS